MFVAVAETEFVVVKPQFARRRVPQEVAYVAVAIERWFLGCREENLQRHPARRQIHAIQWNIIISFISGAAIIYNRTIKLVK